MSESDHIPTDPNVESPPAEESPLERIVDDTEELGDCREWIYNQFVKGRDADSILAELLEQEWPTDEAERLVEEGRRATRRLRGVVTRDEIAGVAERRYRSSFRHAMRMALFGVPMACAYALMILWGSDRIPGRRRKQSRVTQEAENPATPEGDKVAALPTPSDSDSHPT